MIRMRLSVFALIITLALVAGGLLQAALQAAAGAAPAGTGLNAPAGPDSTASPAARLAELAVEPTVQPTGRTRTFSLSAEPLEHEIVDGLSTRVWSFNGRIPGPVLRVQEGDRVVVRFRNVHDVPYSVDFPGFTAVARTSDGAPAPAKAVQPGETLIYEFIASRPGTHFYQGRVARAVATASQDPVATDLTGGRMYGALIVQPRDEQRYWDVEAVWFLDEIPALAAGEGDPYHVINGKAFPDTEPLDLIEGQRVRLRVINAGSEVHALHLHGMSFLVTHADGHPLPEPLRRDTLLIGPGERYDILFVARRGTFFFHDHNPRHVDDEAGPGSATVLVRVRRAGDATAAGQGS